MKKIIKINLSGRVIPIEDSAYEKLQGYIESLRRFFSREEGRDEIINDIESRIAELMNEKVRKGAESITDSDIDEIMASMGRPEDFEADTIDAGASSQTSASADQSSYTYTQPRRQKGRLYRDSSDKILGGVCAGMANYMNIDPAIVRLLFAIITFGGFGFGILLYLLLWIVLPARDLDEYGGKRLYRNPEDRILGGVGSGLAAYFGKDPWTIRIIFLAPFALNIIVSIFSWSAFNEGGIFPNIVFGSLTATFMVAYIVMWIILPEARSDYQKMEMRGEKVDVNTIRQNVKERAREFSEEVKESAANLSNKAKTFAQTRGKTFAAEAGSAAGRVGSGIGRVIGVLFKAFFLFIAGCIAFGLFVGLMALIFGGVSVWPLKNFILDGGWQTFFAWGTLLFFIGVPVVAMLTWLIRRITRVKSKDSYLGWTFGGLWALGWVCVSLFVASLSNDMRRTDKVDEVMSIVQPANDKMIVKVTEPELQYSGSFWWFDNDSEGWDIDQDTLRMANVKLRIQKSPDSLYHVIVSRYSAGKNNTDASERARNIQYTTSYADSVLNLGNGLAIGKNDKFRFQRVAVLIQVPVGKKIRFDESLDRIHPVNIRLYERNRRNRSDWDMEWNWDNYLSWDTNVDYTMNANGDLVDPLAPQRNNRNYRYDGVTPDTTNAERERFLREELKKIEDQKKRDSIQGRSSSGSIKIKEGSETDLSATRSPVFSLVNVFF